jgi:hypothetical protein
MKQLSAFVYFKVLFQHWTSLLIKVLHVNSRPTFLPSISLLSHRAPSPCRFTATHLHKLPELIAQNTTRCLILHLQELRTWRSSCWKGITWGQHGGFARTTGILRQCLTVYCVIACTHTSRCFTYTQLNALWNVLCRIPQL